MKLIKVNNITQLKDGDIITRSNWNFIKRTMEWEFQVYESAPNIPLSKVGFCRTHCGFGSGQAIKVNGQSVSIQVLNGIFTIFYYRVIHPLVHKYRMERALANSVAR